jgi:hypothetical protein
MIERGIGLSVRRQCELLHVSRSSVYEPKVGESNENLQIMKEMDQLHLQDPSAGTRRMVGYLRMLGYGRINRKRIRRLLGDGNHRDLSPETNDDTRRSIRCLSLCIEKSATRSSEPGVVCGHDVYTHAARFHVFSGDHGLVFPKSFGLGDFEYIGYPILRKCFEQSHSDHGLYPQYFQHGSRLSIYVRGMDQSVEKDEDYNQYGWTWPVAGQCRDRTVLAHDQI